MKNLLKKLFFKILLISLRLSNNNKKTKNLKKELESIIPDITNQYTTYLLDTKYLIEQTRYQHTFQISLVLKALEMIRLSNKIGGERKDSFNIVDIGDSSGTHSLYIKAICDKYFKEKVNTISVNLDPVAIQKIREKGLEAYNMRAEELNLGENSHPDIFISFETLEHFFNPIEFLNKLAINAECKYLIITVPYVKPSRVGIQHLRSKNPKEVTSENTHIFELCPDDWDLLYKFSGWKISYSEQYTQYPKRGPLYFLKYLWEKYDFRGFYGVILERDLTYSKLYKDW